LLLTFWFWLADGAAFLDVPMGEGAAMRLMLPPIIFEAAFGIDTARSARWPGWPVSSAGPAL